MTKKEAIEKYLKLALWFSLNMDSKEYSVEVFAKIADKIGKVETELLKLGVTESGIQKLNDHVRRISTSELSELTDKERLFKCQLVFGKEASNDPN